MTDEALPDYAAAVACCGDPQPTIDALTEHLDAQTPPKIMTKLLLQISGTDESGEDDETEHEPPHNCPEATHDDRLHRTGRGAPPDH